MVKVVPIIPPGEVPVDIKKIERAIQNALDGAALGIQADFDTTVMTWSRRVNFKITSPSSKTRVVGTSDEIYGYLDQGTRVRYATMARGYRPKTSPGRIGSRSGGGKVLFISRRRPRPGIAPRHFSKVIHKKWQDEFPTILQRAISSEVR
jgi:hypothetical protein